MDEGRRADGPITVLAIDTCLGALSVAIHRGEATAPRLAEIYEVRATGHAERVMPAIAEAMSVADLTFADLSRLAVTLGPGTFTGVRTGVAAARAISLATGLEVVGLSSLAVMADRIFATRPPAPIDRPVLIAVDARRGQLYVQFFATNALSDDTQPIELTPAAALALCTAPAITVAGSGARLIADAAAATGLSVDIQVMAEHLQPHAGDLARLAGRLTPIRNILPLYLRPPDAKPQTGQRLTRVT